MQLKFIFSFAPSSDEESDHIEQLQSQERSVRPGERSKRETLSEGNTQQQKKRRRPLRRRKSKKSKLTTKKEKDQANQENGQVGRKSPKQSRKGSQGKIMRN